MYSTLSRLWHMASMTLVHEVEDEATEEASMSMPCGTDLGWAVSAL